MLHLKAWERFIGQHLRSVSATFSSRLIGTLQSGCCSTTSAGLACAGESSVSTHEPLGLRSKSNRKCGRKLNKVILMIAISTESPWCKSYSPSLSLLVKAKHFQKKKTTLDSQTPNVEKRKQKVRGVEINNINQWVALHPHLLLFAYRFWGDEIKHEPSQGGLKPSFWSH